MALPAEVVSVVVASGAVGAVEVVSAVVEALSVRVGVVGASAGAVSVGAVSVDAPPVVAVPAARVSRRAVNGSLLASAVSITRARSGGVTAIPRGGVGASMT